LINLLELTNKKALVCGSTQGIGKAIALLLANHGAVVYLLARNESQLIATMAEHENIAGYLVADFANNEAVQTAINGFALKNEIDILVNNTGGPPAGPIVDATNDQFLAALQLHLFNNNTLAKAVLPGMIARNTGRVINIISTSVKAPLHNLGVSNTTRAAVASWAKTLANEVGKYQITVNNVLPGATDTVRLKNIIQNKSIKTKQDTSEVSHEILAEIPMGRFAEASEVANAVLFLASDAAAYINGINLPVDGGRTSCL
jgi:3-oxoacyl-[acyl-carrier protein] reductase